MKRLILFLCVAASSASAQITVTADEFFAGMTTLNNATTYSSTDLTGLSALIALSGAGKTWDFTSRIYIKDTSGADNTTTLLTYPGGAALADDPDLTSSTHVIKVVQKDQTQPIIYEFIKFNQTGFWLVGITQDSAGKKSKLFAYVPPSQVYKFPLTYQTAWSSTSDVHAPGFLPGASFSEATDAVVDGFGTLKLPGGFSDETLRIKKKSTQTISIPSVFTQTTVTYSFDNITKTGRSANISADTNQQPTGVSYSVTQPSSVRNNIPSAEDILNIHLSQNPSANTETTLSYTMKHDGNSQAIMIDPLGNEVWMLHSGFTPAGNNILAIDPAKLSTGIYFIRVTADGVSATRKLIITK